MDIKRRDFGFHDKPNFCPTCGVGGGMIVPECEGRLECLSCGQGFFKFKEKLA